MGVRRLNKAKFANRVTRILGGKNKSTLVAAALTVLLLVGFAGFLLASRANEMQEELRKSTIVASLTAQPENTRIAQILADPKTSALLMDYLNSIAGAVTNLETTPYVELLQFIALLDASKQAGITLKSFDCSPDGKRLSVACVGENQREFLEYIQNSPVFQEAEILELQSHKEKEFTMICYFT